MICLPHDQTCALERRALNQIRIVLEFVCGFCFQAINNLVMVEIQTRLNADVLYKVLTFESIQLFAYVDFFIHFTCICLFELKHFNTILVFSSIKRPLYIYMFENWSF